ncbi:MAG: hypothetical protein OIF48_02980 [Silicimonas sp.]|nr:hypothetical protein [Silicimonas sp.]
MPRYDHYWGSGSLSIYNEPGHPDAAPTAGAVGNGENDVLVMDVSGATLFNYAYFFMGDWNS